MTVVAHPPSCRQGASTQRGQPDRASVADQQRRSPSINNGSMQEASRKACFIVGTNEPEERGVLSDQKG